MWQLIPFTNCSSHHHWRHILILRDLCFTFRNVFHWHWPIFVIWKLCAAAIQGDFIWKTESIWNHLNLLIFIWFAFQGFLNNSVNAGLWCFQVCCPLFQWICSLTTLITFEVCYWSTKSFSLTYRGCFIVSFDRLVDKMSFPSEWCQSSNRVI